MKANSYVPKNPLDPTLTQAWNKGREAGKKEALDQFYGFLKDRMQTLTEIEGIGDKTAWKIQEHFLKVMKE